MRAEENEQTIPLTESVEAYEDAHPSLSSVAPDSDGGRALRRWPRWSPISLQNVVSFILGTFLCLAVVLVKDLSGSKTSSQTCSLQEQKYCEQAIKISSLTSRYTPMAPLRTGFKAP